MMNNVSSSVKITHENGNAFTDRCNELSETDKIVASLRAEYDEKLLNKSLEIIKGLIDGNDITAPLNDLMNKDLQLVKLQHL